MKRMRSVLAVTILALSFPAVSVSAPPPPRDHVQICLNRCGDLYEIDLAGCWADNFVSPSNTGYAICINEAGAGYYFCRRDCH